MSDKGLNPRHDAIRKLPTITEVLEDPELREKYARDSAELDASNADYNSEKKLRLEFVENPTTQEDMIKSYLSYRGLKDESPEKLQGRVDSNLASPSARKYADALLKYRETSDLQMIRDTPELNMQNVVKEAESLQRIMAAEARRLGIPLTKFGDNISWAMWDIGKQTHFFLHQEENGEGYGKPAPPLLSAEKKDEIVNRHLGWEAYAAFNTSGSEWRESAEKDPRFDEARRLLELPPKDNHTLSAGKLAELGGLLRKIA